MKRRRLLLFLGTVMLLLIFALPLNVGAAVTDSGSCGTNVTWTLENEHKLTIAGSGAMDDYEIYSDAPWYAYRSYIETIAVKEGVTNVGRYAFAKCDNLESVSLPASVKTIGDYAFAECESLRVILIPGNETNFGADIFAGGVDPIIMAEKNSAAEVYAKVNAYEFMTYFKDVMNAGSYFFLPVAWAKYAKVVNGVDENHFAPEKTCTRAEFVTILWRAANKPEPENMNTSFKDVPKDSYYYKAVLWAAENNITAGTSATTFSPNQVCTRAQLVTFLWRTAIMIDPESIEDFLAMNYDEPFSDVKEDDYFYHAVVFAYTTGVTMGTTETTFSPHQPCTRGQMVTFFYRFLVAFD